MTFNNPSVAAGIDIGTNTCRLLIAGVRDNRLEILTKELATVRLGQDLIKNKVLSRAAIDRALRVLASFRKTIKIFQPRIRRACGTAALRTAGNRAAFLAMATEALGMEIEIISGEEEALLCLTGALNAFKREITGPLLLADVGGGSTELVYSTGRPPYPQDAVQTASLPLGAVGLTEKFLPRPQPAEHELHDMTNRINLVLQTPLNAWFAENGNNHAPLLVGAGGTATALAALDLELNRYDATLVQDHILTESRLDQLFRRLKQLAPTERRLLPGLEEGRGDILLAGIKIYQTLLDLTGGRRLVISDAGLLEGIIMDMSFHG